MSDADVVVVGAGVAGLVAARELTARGRQVLVLEARDRVGGRTLNAAVPGATVELGGQWVGPGQDRVLALLGELGLGTFPTYDSGRHLIEFGGRVHRRRDTVPRLGPLALADVATTWRALGRAVRRVDVEAPWHSPDAAALDAQTFATWLHRHSRTRGGRRFFHSITRAVFAAEPGELSALWAQFYFASAGGPGAVVSTTGGAQQERIDGGSQRLAERLAAPLGERVVLGTPVRRIAVDDGGVTVHPRTGVAVRARRVIVAVPPALIGGVDFDPPLPPGRQALLQRLPHGAVVKANVVYDEPFWRRQGLSGQAASEDRTVSMVFDNSPAGGTPGVLVCFVEGHAATAFGALGPARRRARVLDDLAAYFGPAARRSTGYVDHDWTADPWSRGCYGAFGAPGALTRYGPVLRTPTARVHWAGAETAVRWVGYLDGAVESGQRAAGEVEAALSGSAPSPATDLVSGLNQP
ncbi:FAD-dependent oxidoreductase [Actinoplanes sp. NPDC049118]|uniref:flavin monoamine oxidase family protein n=1 Tax=Actinoplanes sp. NPDC049118 TaxID=3155769 RepID=UPI0033D7ADA3